MKHMRTGVVAIALALVALVFACKGEGTAKTAKLGEAFRLKIAESAKLSSDDLTVRFKAVTNDSRCPQGTQCVTAGEAEVVLAVEVGKENLDVTVKVGTDQAKASVEPYTIRILALDPYPVANQTIQDADRELELRIDRTAE